jgi:hypothetical protein
MWQIEVPAGSESLGYRALVELFNITCAPHYRWSYASPKWEKREVRFDDQNLSIHLYPPSYRLEKNPFAHLEFALKHEGCNLTILKKTFEELSPEDVTKFVMANPTGRYARLVWYLCENLVGHTLPIPDTKKGNYVPLLDPDLYYCGSPRRSRRHRVIDNLLGSLTYCPVVRKTPLLQQFEAQCLDQAAKNVVHQYDPKIIERAMRYLYTKETIASWEIEREKPDKTRLARFSSLLQKADIVGPLSEQVLVELQKEIVDPRFALTTYRDFQNYIGEEPALGHLIIHYIPPRPEDVPLLMKGLLETYERAATSGINPVIAASLLAFGFVFIHPFWDGNGRLHRFLIHYALSRSGFSPPGIVFPVSAAILRDSRAYDLVLETFSKPLLGIITDYQVDDTGKLTVAQETRDLYEFVDLTPCAEYLFRCVERTITTDFRAELQFLQGYDLMKQQIKNHIDMPDQSLDLFIKCVRQNNGRLSARKREQYFPMLIDDEIHLLEQIINRVSGHTENVT